ncbi:MAG: adenylyltransferase/cytidyltransferase family protein [Clostridia bacterium]|nr:adenylyltransferase/cytidyltransferase family protein [Clostridia bacterium]
MSDKPYSLGITVGRFQTVHSGHIMMIKCAMAICDEVALFVGSSQESGTEKNPFSYDMRREMLSRVFADSVKIFPLPDAGLGNCAAWGEYVLDNAKARLGRLPDVVISGKEGRRVSWLEGKTGDGVAELYVPKTIQISASEMRDFFLKDDEESWRAYTDPAIWDMYDGLREAVLSSLGNEKTDSI